MSCKLSPCLESWFSQLLPSGAPTLDPTLCTAVSSHVCVNYRMNVEPQQLGDGCNMSGDVARWRPHPEAAALTSVLFSPGLWFSWVT